MGRALIYGLAAAFVRRRRQRTVAIWDRRAKPTISSRHPRDGRNRKHHGAIPTSRGCGRSRSSAACRSSAAPAGAGAGGAPPPPCDLNKAFLTEAEYQERLDAATKQVDRHAAGHRRRQLRPGPAVGVTDPTAPQRQTSLIVDPPNGKLPEMTAEGKRLSALMKSSWALPGETPGVGS